MRPPCPTTRADAGRRRCASGARHRSHEVFDLAGTSSIEAAELKAEKNARCDVLIDARPRAIDAELEKATKWLKKPAAPRGTKGKKA